LGNCIHALREQVAQNLALIALRSVFLLVTDTEGMINIALHLLDSSLGIADLQRKA